MSAIIKRQRVTSEAPAPRPHAQTSIRVLKSGGEVFAVEVTCACGEVTVVELVAEDTQPGRAADTPH